MAVVALREKLATRLGVDVLRLATGCGSVALAEHLVRATTLGPQDEVLYSWRSFEAYPIITAAGGAPSVRVPNRPDHSHDPSAMAAPLPPRPPLGFGCNPHNPTRTARRRAALDPT